MSIRKILLSSFLLILCSQMVYAETFRCPQPSEFNTQCALGECTCVTGFQCTWTWAGLRTSPISFSSVILSNATATCTYFAQGQIGEITGIFTKEYPSILQPVSQQFWNQNKHTKVWMSLTSNIMDLKWEYQQSK